MKREHSWLALVRGAGGEEAGQKGGPLPNGERMSIDIPYLQQREEYPDTENGAYRSGPAPPSGGCRRDAAPAPLAEHRRRNADTQGDGIDPAACQRLHTGIPVRREEYSVVEHDVIVEVAQRGRREYRRHQAQLHPML